jgi:hypothetical protein
MKKTMSIVFLLAIAATLFLAVASAMAGPGPAPSPNCYPVLKNNGDCYMCCRPGGCVPVDPDIYCYGLPK